MTPAHAKYQIVLEMYPQGDSGGSRPLASVPIEPDWGPALECVRFAASRRSEAEILVLERDDGIIEPVWHSTAGPPYVKALRAVVARGGQDAVTMEIPLSYFGQQAQAIGADLVKSRKLSQGEPFLYVVCAYPRESARVEAATKFSVEAATEPLPMALGSLDDYFARGTKYDAFVEEDMPVFVPQSVIHEAVALTHEAGAAETGGVLIGHLYRDARRLEIFAEVTAQIPARHAEQELTRLTFTADTWADVNAALALRGLDELYLGWWHSHPARQWCKDCPIENRKRCKLSGEFFSAQDVALHRCVFPRAYSVALVISDSYATGLTWPMFGWRNGVVLQRGFHVLDAQGNAANDLFPHAAHVDSK
jgi:hypothetical protein